MGSFLGLFTGVLHLAVNFYLADRIFKKKLINIVDVPAVAMYGTFWFGLGILVTFGIFFLFR